MYNNTQLLSSHNNFINRRVLSGNKNEADMTYVQSQTGVINNNNKKVPKNYKPPYDDMYTAMPGIFGKRFPPKSHYQGINSSDNSNTRYDPYGEYLFKKGLSDRDNSLSYYTNYINIDSSFRNKNSIPQTDDTQWIKLDSNPLRFSFNSKNLEVIDENYESEIQIDDKIMMAGILPIKKKLKTIYGDKNQNKLFEFTNGSKYLKINNKHYMKFPETFAEISEYNKFTYIENYDTKNVNVEISGIQGELGTNYIGNIAINTLNSTHQVLLYNPDESAENTYNDNWFFIELTTEYSSPIPYNVPPYNVDITYYYLAGVPINQINAEYPIDDEHVTGYHRVVDVSEESFTISLPKVSTLLDESICSDGQGKCGGGNNITIAKISEIITAYPNPNHYLIKLPYTYSQVVYIKMISSEFPNVQKNINDTGVNKNNKLYWQNLEDGDIVYSIDIESGTYNPLSLQNAIEQKILSVRRVYSRNISESQSNNIEYTENNIIKLTIDEKTEIVTFKSYTEATIYKPFIETNPKITNTNPIGLLKYSITINQINHRMKVGDKIIINNSLSYFGIPAKVLNGEHVITEIINENQYIIIVKNFNLEDDRTDTGGGSCVSILTPNIFRLRFDFPDTMGRILGFRNPGSNIAITPYNNVITNKDDYEKELGIDEEGNLVAYTNNSLLFSADNYILVVCKQIIGISNFGDIKDVFAKIQLPDALSSIFNSSNISSNRMILDTFVDAPIYFHSPIRNLYELEFEFYTPDGQLYDFGGLDHSFTLEVVTMSDTPKGTGLVSFN